ncbi:MAG: MTH938/NDUFAF3 family protein [Candidatus Zixiibacteriota bacterium]
MIDSYDFGEVVIDGRKYTSDLIICPDGIKDQWFRREGHRLCTDDLGDVLDKKPDVIVVGTGNPGLMRVLPETEKLIESKGIKLIVQPTREACRTYNQLTPSQEVIALLHLTC